MTIYDCLDKHVSRYVHAEVQMAFVEQALNMS